MINGPLSPSTMCDLGMNIRLSSSAISAFIHPGSLRLASHKWDSIPNSFLTDHTWPPQVLSSRCGPSCPSRIVSWKTAGMKEEKIIGRKERKKKERDRAGVFASLGNSQVAIQK